MNEEQFDAIMALLVKQMAALESIAHSLQKLTTPMVTVSGSTLSQVDLDSTRKTECYIDRALPVGTIPMSEWQKLPENQKNLQSVNSIGLTGKIANALDGINGCGFNSHDYAARLLRRMQKRGFPDLTMAQLESMILTFTGNTVKTHWENQASTEFDCK